MSETKAFWSIRLDCTCPECGHNYDILESASDFLTQITELNLLNMEPSEQKILKLFA